MFFLRLFCTLSLVVCVGKSAFAAEDLVKAMTDHLSCYPLELINIEQQEPTITRQDLCLAAIYHETGAEPIWVTDEGPGRRAEIVFTYLKHSYEEGLDPADYQVSRLEELWGEKNYASLAQLDTLLTYNVVKYVHDVSHGQLEPLMADPKLFAEAGEKSFDPVAAIEQINAAEDLDGFFQALPPANIHYEGLKKGLADYRTFRELGEWQQIQRGKNIFPGDSSERIPLIRTRLALLGREAATETDADSPLYDEALKERVLLFQSRHGLKTDGIIGRNTINELNISPAARIEQIKINMARWRWQDHEFGSEYLLVNIANFRLYGYRGNELVLSLPVIVGTLQHQTPVFSDRLKYVDFNPFWNVPPSIAKNKDLPELKVNPNYLAEKNIRLFSSWQADAVELDSTIIDWNSVTRSQMARYKLRQDPGPHNALGKVKFVFPNKYAVYLHDTPAKNLFSEHYRFFSHGCIRVSNPEKLAQFVLEAEKEQWSETEITELFQQDERKVVRVRRSLPIHLTYQTAWLDKGGGIHFNRDVYARDKKLQKALLTK